MTTGSTFNTRPLAALRHHVTGAIERGEAEAITAIEAEPGDSLAFARRVALANAAEHLLATLKTVRDAHQYDGALTMGTARLSPAILGTVERAIALVEEA